MPDIGSERWRLLVVPELDQLGGILALIRREWMHGQRSEAAAEIHQVVRRDVLIAEQDEFMFDQRGFHSLKLRV